MQSIRVISLIFLPILLAATPLQASTACSEFALEGKQHDYQVQVDGKFLGSGKNGAVYRGVENGVPFIVKFYKDKFHFDRDLEMMRFLRRVVGATSEGGCFTVPEISTRATELAFVSKDIRGQDLHALLMHPETPPAEKTRLRAQYQSLKNGLIKALSIGEIEVQEIDQNNSVFLNFFSDHANDGLTITTIRASGLLTKILLKTDNIIVEEDSGRMYLVDPR